MIAVILVMDHFSTLKKYEEPILQRSVLEDRGGQNKAKNGNVVFECPLIFQRRAD